MYIKINEKKLPIKNKIFILIVEIKKSAMFDKTKKEVAIALAIYKY
jgi:hypothetical protein